MDSSCFTVFMQTRNLPICQSVIEYLLQAQEHRYALYIQSYDFNKENGDYEFKSVFEFLIIQTVIKYKNISNLSQITKQQQSTSDTNTHDITFISNYKHQSILPSSTTSNKTLSNRPNITSHCTNDVLRHLSLISCHVDDNKLNILSSFLYMFPQLLSLDLQHNQITHHSLPLLLDALTKSCHYIDTLRFDYNHINTKGAKFIAKVIQTCGNSLKILSISNNPLQNLGACYILHSCLNRHRRAARKVKILIEQLLAAMTTNPSISLSSSSQKYQSLQQQQQQVRMNKSSPAVPVLRSDGGHIYQDYDLIDHQFKKYIDNIDSSSSSKGSSRTGIYNNNDNCVTIPDDDNTYNDHDDSNETISNSIKDSHKYQQYQHLYVTNTNNTATTATATMGMTTPHRKFRHHYHRLKYKLVSVTAFLQVNSYQSILHPHHHHHHYSTQPTSNRFHNSDGTISPYSEIYNQQPSYRSMYVPRLAFLNLSNCILSCDDNNNTHDKPDNDHDEYEEEDVGNNRCNSHSTSLFLQILQLVLCDSKYLVDIDFSHNHIADEGAVVLSCCILMRSMTMKEVKKMNHECISDHHHHVGYDCFNSNHNSNHSNKAENKNDDDDDDDARNVAKGSWQSLRSNDSLTRAAASSLRSLRLSYCGITDIGIQSLCEAITITRTLHTLDLSSSSSSSLFTASSLASVHGIIEKGKRISTTTMAMTATPTTTVSANTTAIATTSTTKASTTINDSNNNAYTTFHTTSTPNCFSQTGLGWIASTTSTYSMDGTTLIFTSIHPLPSRHMAMAAAAAVESSHVGNNTIKKAEIYMRNDANTKNSNGNNDTINNNINRSSTEYSGNPLSTLPSSSSSSSMLLTEYKSLYNEYSRLSRVI